MQPCTAASPTTGCCLGRFQASTTCRHRPASLVTAAAQQEAQIGPTPCNCHQPAAGAVASQPTGRQCTLLQPARQTLRLQARAHPTAGVHTPATELPTQLVNSSVAAIRGHGRPAICPAVHHALHYDLNNSSMHTVQGGTCTCVLIWPAAERSQLPGTASLLCCTSGPTSDPQQVPCGWHARCCLHRRGGE